LPVGALKTGIGKIRTNLGKTSFGEIWRPRIGQPRRHRSRGHGTLFKSQWRGRNHLPEALDVSLSAIFRVEKKFLV